MKDEDLRRLKLPINQRKKECVDVSADGTRLSEDQFLCSICGNGLTDPVSTSCGHNFCKHCLTDRLNTKDKCPMCKELLTSRSELKVNTLLSRMTTLFQGSKPGDVPCDVCTGMKLKALKSCLVCQISFCEAHLEPHVRVSRLKKHQLIDPVHNLEERVCRRHNKPLERFCVADRTRVCTLCLLFDHRTHEIVPLKEYEEKMAEMGRLDAEIQKRRLKIEALKQSLKFCKDHAATEGAKGVQVFTSLKESLEEEQAEFITTMEGKQGAAKARAKTFIRVLEEEISAVRMRKTKVEQLSLYDDHLSLIESLQSLNIDPVPTKDSSQVGIIPVSYEGTVVRSLVLLEETITREKKLLAEAELKKFQEYAADVTFDPRTAHSRLKVSDDGKEVDYIQVKKTVPANSQRFSRCLIVLGRQSFSSGRHYFEVKVKGKTVWTLGVARESIKRDGNIKLSPDNGIWALCLRNGFEYTAHDHRPQSLSLGSPPQRIGVFVDCEEGVVTFYDTDAPTLIYSYTGCSFTHKLLPYFCPGFSKNGENSAPLVICNVT